MDDLKFNHNWNGKVNNDYFTTIRLWNERKYIVGTRFKCYLKGKYIGEVEVMSVKQMYIDQINDWMAWLDAGYSAKTTQQMLREMYKNKPTIRWESQALAYVMLKRIKEKDEPNLFG